MYPNLSVTDGRGRSMPRLFSGTRFPSSVPGFPLGLAQSRPLAYGERRFFAGMVTAVGGDPVTEGAFVYSELLGYPGDRTRCLDHHFHCFVLVFRREALLRSWQNFTLSRSSILMDGLSGKSGAPHREKVMERGESLYVRWGFLAVFVTPAIVSGTAKMPPYRFAFWNLLDSLGWTVSVAASADGIGRLATGHHTWHDIAILAIGLAAGALVTVTAVRRHRRRTARRPAAIAGQPPGNPP